VRRVLLFWTLFATVLIGTGVIDRLHRISHLLAHGGTHHESSDASHRLADAAVLTSGCGRSSGPDGADRGDDRCDGHHNDGHSHGGSDDGGSPADHDDHQCPVCVTLASLGGTPAQVPDDPTPIAILVGRADIADDLTAAPTPLAAIHARPPPTH
jgi:hypothetical protein